MKSTRKALGQYMTPGDVARLMASHIPAGTTAVVDLAAGDCSLLRAVADMHPSVALYGCEIDDGMHRKGQSSLPAARIRSGNGLEARLQIRAADNSRVSVIANPPYTETDVTPAMSRLLSLAFPDVSTKLGYKRAELYFLARSLLLARKTGGIVAILMPMGFGDGDIYRHYRRSLMANYGLLKAVEVQARVFGQTEARTVLLVIDTSKSVTQKVEISRFDADSGKSALIYRGLLDAGARLDARYQEGRIFADSAQCRLADLGVTIVRGRVSYKESRDLAMPAVHTSDLSRARRGKLDIEVQTRESAEENAFFSEIVAETGDILLSRTGTRVSWKPIVVKSGRAPITDHVFRIRVPAKQKQRVARAFKHPAFESWLASVAKGVCATVITKKDLMAMPIFETAIKQVA
jgi:hypothetical protein